MQLDPDQCYVFPKTQANFNDLVSIYNATVHSSTYYRLDEISYLMGDDDWTYIVYNENKDNNIYCASEAGAEDIDYAIELKKVRTLKIRKIKGDS